LPKPKAKLLFFVALGKALDLHGRRYGPIPVTPLTVLVPAGPRSAGRARQRPRHG
jgi:hypothetical protein